MLAHSETLPELEHEVGKIDDDNEMLRFSKDRSLMRGWYFQEKRVVVALWDK